MKIDMIKQPGGCLVPVSDIESQAMNRFKTGEQYQIEIKLSKNPAFHRKTFTFFTFCFNYWRCDRGFIDERGQFEFFRNRMTILAGFYTEYFNLKNEPSIVANSLSYAKMEQETFEQHYNALINAAMKHIFVGCGREIEDQLRGYF